MVAPNKRWKKRKFRKTPGGTVKIHFAKKKTGKCECTLCGKAMHGMPHGKTVVQVRRMKKSERRPSVIFAGTLCNQCRKKVIDEAIKVKEGLKELSEVKLDLKKFVEIGLRHMK